MHGFQIDKEKLNCYNHKNDIQRWFIHRNIFICFSYSPLFHIMYKNVSCVSVTINIHRDSVIHSKRGVEYIFNDKNQFTFNRTKGLHGDYIERATKRIVKLYKDWFIKELNKILIIGEGI